MTGCELRPTEILQAIENQLTPDGMRFWNGWANQNEAIILAQREGLAAAVELVEGLARPEDD